MEIEKQNQLKLKPINKGLGLDQFSNGLPYTPDRGLKNYGNNTKKVSQAREFVAFNFPESRMAQAYVTKKIEKFDEDSTIHENTQIKQKVSLYLFKAYVLDVVVVTLSFTFVVLFGLYLNHVQFSEVFYIKNNFVIFTAFYLSFIVSYFVLLQSVFGTTIGKVLFNQKAKSIDTQDFSC